MITVIIKDAESDDVEITRFNFCCIEEADQEMPQIMYDFLATYGSGSCGFYGVIDGNPIHTGEIVSCEFKD